MKTGYRYLAATAAIGLIGAVFVAYAKAYPVIMMFFTVFVLLPLFVVFFYIGVLELILGNRLGGGPGRGEELVPAADVLVELAGHADASRLDRLEEHPSRPDHLAA